MQMVQRISAGQRWRINAKLRRFGLELAGASVSDSKAFVSINKSGAATYNQQKVVNALKNSFGTKLSAIIVDGREYVV